MEPPVEDLEKFRTEAHDWLDSHVPKALRGLVLPEDGGSWGGRNPTWDHPDMEAWLAMMAEQGWTAPTWPREYGGGGLSPAGAKVLHGELRKLKLPLRARHLEGFLE